MSWLLLNIRIPKANLVLKQVLPRFDFSTLIFLFFISFHFKMTWRERERRNYSIKKINIETFLVSLHPFKNHHWCPVMGLIFALIEDICGHFPMAHIDIDFALSSLVKSNHDNNQKFNYAYTTKFFLRAHKNTHAVILSFLSVVTRNSATPARFFFHWISYGVCVFFCPSVSSHLSYFYGLYLSGPTWRERKV